MSGWFDSVVCYAAMISEQATFKFETGDLDEIMALTVPGQSDYRLLTIYL